MKAVSTDGARLRELRTALKLTQRALAHDCGVPATVICHVEAGRRSLSLARQFRVAARLGVSVQDITTVVEEPVAREQEVPA